MIIDLSNKYKLKQINKPRYGFTVMELMVTILIIGVLATIGIIAYTGVQQRAIVSSLQTDLINSAKLIKYAQSTSNSGVYPSTIDCSATPAANSICLKSSSGSTYSYSVDNVNNPLSYTLIETSTNGTQYVITDNSTPIVYTAPQPSAPAATLTSPTAIDITPSDATLGANITSDGGSSITERGVCWGLSAAPTSNCTSDGLTATGVFTKPVTGMPANTTIYYRGYAKNSGGSTGYSSDGTFTTPNGVQIQPGPDTGMDTCYGTVYVASGCGDYETLYAGGWGDYYYDYFQYDLSTGPSAANTTSAEFWIWTSRSASQNDPGFTVNQITSSWSESTLSRYLNPTSVYYGPTPALPIGDRAWVKIDITTLYKNWKNNVYPNYGIKISPQYNNNTAGSMYTCENPDTFHRSKLVIKM